MKKTIIAVALAAVIGGGYFVAQKATASFGDKQLNAMIELHKKQPYVIQTLQSHPVVERADIKIIESTNDTIKSILTIDVVDEQPVEIPLTSVITHGKAIYQDKSYGYGKIVTTPDVKALKLPEFIKADTLTNTTYIGLDGSLLNVTDAKPVAIQEEGIDFKGFTSLVDTNIANTSVADSSFKFAGVNGKKGSKSFSLEPFSINVVVDKDGNYKGDSSPITFKISKYGRENGIILSKGEYKGNFEAIKGINVAIGASSAKYDNLTFSEGKKSLKLKNINIEGGAYKSSKNNLLDIKGKLSLEVDESASNDLLQKLPVKLSPKSFSFDYGLTNVSYDVVNGYFDLIKKLDGNNDVEKLAITKGLQENDAQFYANTAIKTSAGDAIGDMELFLSEAGKTAKTEDLLNGIEYSKNGKELEKYFEFESNIKVSKALADITEASMFLMMAGAKLEKVDPKDDKSDENYVLNAKMKDGELFINGNPNGEPMR